MPDMLPVNDTTVHACTCPLPTGNNFHCERHQCDKVLHWWKLCQTRSDYRQLWEDGKGPGQQSNEPRQPPPDISCAHRGPVSRSLDCPSCMGVNATYYCPLHGECTLNSHSNHDLKNLRGEKHQACSLCDDRQSLVGVPPREIRLRMGLAPGDNVVATAAVRELQAQYPGRFLIDILTFYPELWKNNPDVRSVAATPQEDRDCPTGTISMSGQQMLDQADSRPGHYIQSYALHLSRVLSLPVPLEMTKFHGRIELDDFEKTPPDSFRSDDRPVFLVCAGGKRDSTVKIWPQEHFQDVADSLRDRVRFLQVGAVDADSGGHTQPPLSVAADLRGRTTHRQLIRMVAHCDGVLCGNSYLMHLAAAVPRIGKMGLRPCVVLAGGREGAHWFQYPGHAVLHSVGAYDCCLNGGCWKDRVVPLGDGRPYDNMAKLCAHPTATGAQCMVDIAPEQVAAAIERYLP